LKENKKKAMGDAVAAHGLQLHHILFIYTGAGQTTSSLFTQHHQYITMILTVSFIVAALIKEFKITNLKFSVKGKTF